MALAVVGGGDQVDDLHALLATAGDGAPELGDLGGAGELDPSRGGDDLDRAGRGAAVAAGGGTVAGHGLPREVLAGLEQGGLLAFTVNA